MPSFKRHNAIHVVTLAWCVSFGASLVFAQPCARTETQKLIASDASAGHRLGDAVAKYNDLAVVGARSAEEGGIASGAAYIFRRAYDCAPSGGGGDCWVELDKITSLDAALGDWFGGSVAISGDRIIVGARFRVVESRSGAAFVFRRDQNDTPSDPFDDFWVQEQMLWADNAGVRDDFGFSVSIDGDRAIVGVPNDDNACVDDPDCNSGSAWVFRHDDNGTPLDFTDDFWVKEDKLIASDTALGDNFGFSVALSGDYAVVGAWHVDIIGTDSGAAYVFRRDDNDSPLDASDDFWVQEDKLIPSDASPFDNFGVAVAISGERTVVGSWLDDDGGNLSGAAYVFRHDENKSPLDPSDDFWIEEDKLIAADAAAGDEFGKSVSIDGDLIAVGAFEDDDACINDVDPDPHCDSGSAYVFRRFDNLTPSDPGDDFWIQTTKLVPSDADAGDFFGRVAIHGDQVFAGSVDDAAGVGAGAAYVFTVARSCTDLADFAGFQACFDPSGVSFDCARFDWNGQAGIDLEDFRRMVSTLTGP